MITITYNKTPISTQHIYAQRGWRKFMTPKAKMFKEDFLASVKKQLPKQFKPLTGLLEVKYFLVFPDKRRRDWDNYAKIVFDTLNEIVYRDDSQIVKAIVTKKYKKGVSKIVLKIKEL